MKFTQDLGDFRKDKFGEPLIDLAQHALKELIKNDYGADKRFDGINMHPLEDHGSHGLHEQTTLFKKKEPDSDMIFRFAPKPFAQRPISIPIIPYYGHQGQ